MEKLPILLLDPSIERACDAQFLLQLAQYRVSLVHQDDEAFNWIISRLDSIEQPALLLVNYFQVDMPIFSLIAQLRQRGAKLPILFISRDEIADCAALAMNHEAVYCCRPENMLGQLRVLTADR